MAPFLAGIITQVIFQPGTFTCIYIIPRRSGSTWTSPLFHARIYAT